MDYFGDESGHLRGLLQGDCEVYVVGVVAGDRVSCGRCPKRTVRDVNDLPEAKWNDLTDIQKRRLFECFEENEHLSFGYAKFTRDHLESLQKSHLLYQNVTLPPDWDLALQGYTYGELLFEMDATDDRRPVFTFDRVASKPQSDAIKKHLRHFISEASVFYEGSRQTHGIQAADCFAGAVAEDHRKGTDWLDYLEDKDVVEGSYMGLLQLENDLEEYDAGP